MIPCTNHLSITEMKWSKWSSCTVVPCPNQTTENSKPLWSVNNFSHQTYALDQKIARNRSYEQHLIITASKIQRCFPVQYTPLLFLSPMSVLLFNKLDVYTFDHASISLSNLWRIHKQECKIGGADFAWKTTTNLCLGYLICHNEALILKPKQRSLHCPILLGLINLDFNRKRDKRLPISTYDSQSDLGCNF